MATGTLTEKNLVHPREGTYFVLLLVISCLLWLCLLFGIFVLPFVALAAGVFTACSSRGCARKA